jgi:Fe-S cluster biogenesis protein NfuA
METRATSNGNDSSHSGGDERTLADLVADIARLEGTFAGWEPEQRASVAAYKRAIEALHAEALRRLVRACKSEPAALAALRTAAGDEVVYAVMRQLGLLKPSLDERVGVALESVRPMLASHGGDVELLRVAPPRVELRFLGACDGCASSGVTFRAGVEEAVRDACPEITEVVEVRGTRSAPVAASPAAGELVSPFALVARRSRRHGEST